MGDENAAVVATPAWRVEADQHIEKMRHLMVASAKIATEMFGAHPPPEMVLAVFDRLRERVESRY